MSNVIDVKCPKCGASIEADDSVAGMEISCPNCRYDIKLPSAKTSTWLDNTPTLTTAEAEQSTKESRKLRAIEHAKHVANCDKIVDLLLNIGTLVFLLSELGAAAGLIFGFKNESGLLIVGALSSCLSGFIFLGLFRGAGAAIRLLSDIEENTR